MDVKLSNENWNHRWRKKLFSYILRHRKSNALRLLNKLIEKPLPLFIGDEQILEERRMAWLFKIDLLREWGRLSEALAWICLECELHPENITAQALKERLKNDLDLIKKEDKNNNRATSTIEHENFWKGVAGMRELKALLERDVILPLQFPELYRRYKVPLPNGILLYGPAGCGKTFFTRKLSEHLGYHFIETKPSDLASIYVHGTQQLIGKLFEEAIAHAPCLLFIDEIDAFVPNRGGHNLGHHYSAEVNEFLTQLNECSKRNILVVAATNLIDNIDTAILRPGRMDKKIFVSPPDQEARSEAFKLFMEGRPQETIDWIRISEYSDCYTFAEIEHVVNEAARHALVSRVNITTNGIIEALISNPSALTVEKIIEIKKSGER